MRIPSAAARAVPLMCLCLAGCSGLFQSKAKPEQIYYLRAPAAASTPAAAPSGAMPVSIRVGRPVADPGLGTPHIMLVQPDHRMNFYSGSRWPAAAPELIEALVVQTLQASGEWASVEDSASPFPSDYLLTLHVRRFEAEYTSGSDAPRTVVVLDCIVGRGQGREVLATFTVSGAQAASTNRLGEVVAAFEQATGTALNMLAQQSAQAVRLDAQRAAPGGEPAPAVNR